MRVPYPGFVGGTSALLSPQVNAERTVNLFPEISDTGTGKARAWLRATPGLVEFATCGIGPVRALFHEDGRCFAIAGHYLYELFSDGSAVQRGEVVNDGRKASIATNGNIGRQLFITSGLAGYVFDLTTNTLTRVTAAGFPPAVLMGLFADSYFLALWSGAPKFSFSSLANGALWDALDIGQRSQSSDNVLAMMYDHRELWLLGSAKTEIWYNAGANDNPWTPQQVLIEHGIAAADSIAKGFDSLFWLKNGKTVVQSSGYAVVPIGSQAVHTAIAGYSRTDDAIGWCQEDEGHQFYWLTFPTVGKTWCYDLTTQAWHERLRWNGAEGAYEAHVARCYVEAFDKHLVGSRLDGKVYSMTRTAYDDAGATIRRLRRAPHVHAAATPIELNRFELDMAVGVGLTSGQGADPQVMLRVSNNGGKTFGTERMARMGGEGDYGTLVYWNRFGQARSRVLECVWTDPVFVGINEAWMDIAPVAA